MFIYHQFPINNNNYNSPKNVIKITTSHAHSKNSQILKTFTRCFDFNWNVNHLKVYLDNEQMTTINWFLPQKKKKKWASDKTVEHFIIDFNCLNFFESWSGFFFHSLTSCVYVWCLPITNRKFIDSKNIYELQICLKFIIQLFRED